jgi:hypothetical protein
MNPKAHVTRDIADLVPQFLRSRQLELESLRAALAALDEARLLALGERMYAVGNPYGFQHITTLGRHVMESTARRDFNSIRHLISQYADYLKAVEIVHIDRPAKAAAVKIQTAAPATAPTIAVEAQPAAA